MKAKTVKKKPRSKTHTLEQTQAEYERGFRTGKRLGREEAQREIRQALGIIDPEWLA